MEGIRSGPRDHVDHRRAGKTILRAEVRLFHAKFFHGLRRRRVGDLRDAGPRVGDGGAIHQHVGGGITAAVGDEVGARAVDGALIVRFGDARREHGQVHHIAVHQRQIVDELSVDDQAGGRVLRVEPLCLRFHIDGLRGTRHFEAEVHRHILIHVHPYASAHGLLEARHLRRHRIHTRRNGAVEIAACSIRSRIERVALVLIGQGHLDPWDHGSGCVGQHATHSPKVSLAEKRCRHRQ